MAAPPDAAELQRQLAAKEDEVSRLESQMVNKEAEFIEVMSKLESESKARDAAEEDAEAQREHLIRPPTMPPAGGRLRAVLAASTRTG